MALKILVTGAKGFVGKNLVLELKNFEFEKNDEIIDGIQYYYFLDANIEDYDNILKIIKKNNYTFLGFEE
jgi:nucleoside-diphosphate-sugar epimerase